MYNPFLSKTDTGIVIRFVSTRSTSSSPSLAEPDGVAAATGERDVVPSPIPGNRSVVAPRPGRGFDSEYRDGSLAPNAGFGIGVGVARDLRPDWANNEEAITSVIKTAESSRRIVQYPLSYDL